MDTFSNYLIDNDTGGYWSVTLYNDGSMKTERVDFIGDEPIVQQVDFETILKQIKKI